MVFFAGVFTAALFKKKKKTNPFFHGSENQAPSVLAQRS
jgi:hypothetical protein